jgi:hypothetical protein
MIPKRKIYVILLLLLIIFIALSFYYILHFCDFGFCSNIQEGLCLPSCSKVSINTTTGEIPQCSELILKIIEPKDAGKIYSECIHPFIKKIDETMKQNYNYDTIFTLYNENIYLTSSENSGTQQGRSGTRSEAGFVRVKNENQIQINSYFTDFSNNITLQDKMDNLISNLSKIQGNPIFNKHPKKDNILESLQKYENERKTELLTVYNKLITDIEPYGENILIEDDCMNDENRHFYKDENFRLLIKEQKENLVTYGSKSSFHIIEDYLKQGIEGKLTTGT